ncbi:MAG: hypothetical protein HN948_07225 [Clostridia bacterium]|jgi:hypothetical protein|nr:hypothetical protein [Clostridia bacterium]MBT7122785.1 hypothetical protein [Clostridia bacterium]
MKKLTKRTLIIFGISAVGLAITIAVILGAGILKSADNSEVTTIGTSVEHISLNTDNANVTLIESDELKIKTSLNLWADEQILASDVAVITSSGGVLTITETPPGGKFLGLFAQPYELKITIHAPAGMVDDID